MAGTSFDVIQNASGVRVPGSAPLVSWEGGKGNALMRKMPWRTKPADVSKLLVHDWNWAPGWGLWLDKLLLKFSIHPGWGVNCIESSESKMKIES